MQPFKYSPNNNSGSRRCRIVFLRPETTTDELGQEDQEETNWIEFKRAWAAIKTIKGSEYVSSGADRTTIISRFIIHYTEGITSDMRIDYKGSIFEIIEPPINDDEANKTLTIIAKEKR